MSAALDAILADAEAMLDVTVELDSAKRSDGTLKTWYYSFQGRSTGGGDTPANTEFPAYVKSVGPLSQSLSEDVAFAGNAQNDPGSIVLVQPLPDSDQMSQLNDYTFKGYQCRIKIGRMTDAYSAFQVLASPTCAAEPESELTEEGIRVTIKLASALGRMLEERLLARRYVGISTGMTYLTSTGAASASHIAAYDLLSYTLSGKFRVAAAQTWNQVLTRKGAAGNQNWSVFLGSSGGGSSGKLIWQASFGSVSTILATSPLSYVDGEWHTWVAGLLDKTTAYLMIDGAVVGTFAPTVAVDVQTAAINFGLLSFTPIGTFCDMRLYDHYIAPGEARGLVATRGDGDDLGCIGLWRFDDNAGSTANDYSSNNNDATISGTQSTDWKWDATDLGDPELAGRPMPIVVGDVLNAPAHLIDSNRNRFRGNVDASNWHSSGSNTTIAVRSRGTLLTGGGTDYTTPSDGGGGVFSMTAAEDEPVTYDLRSSGAADELFFLPEVVEQLLTNRTRLSSPADIDGDQIDALLLLCPWLAGYWTDVDATALQALQDLLGQSGLYYHEKADGRLFIDMLLPPAGYGPYGEACLDLRQRGYVTFGDIADVTGSMTIALWFKSNLVDQTAYTWGGAEPNAGSATLITKGGAPGNYYLYFQAIGGDAGKLKFRTAGVTVESPADVVEASVWHFGAGVFDATGDTSKLYVAPLGGTLREVASIANTGTPSTNSNALAIGDTGAFFPWAAVHGAQVWAVAKTLGQLQALMATPPVGNEANLVAYVPLNEGAGTPVEVVTSTAGTLSGAQWAPKLAVNLNDTPSVTLTQFRHSSPASDIIVHYNRNRFPMTNADIDTGVSQADRLALTRAHEDAPYDNDDIRDRFKGAQKIELNSPITDRESAQRLLRSLVTRFGTDRYLGVLTFPEGLIISRQACGLAIGDEIGVTASIPSQLATARSFRVIAVSHNPITLSTQIGIWG